MKRAGVKAEIFLDAAYAIALASPNDYFHEQGVHLARQLQQSKTCLVTTRAVILEIGNALSKKRHRQDAVTLLTALETDPNVKIIPLSEQLYDKAFLLFQDRPDKEWGLTDCVSFVIMTERKIGVALTTDVHFEQVGFQVLLRKESK